MARHHIPLSWADARHWQDVPRTNTVGMLVDQMGHEARQVAERKELACFLSGPPGCGKNHVVADALRTSGLDAIYKTPRDYRDLMLAFWEAGDHRAIVLDEADQVFRSERCLNMLKLATDPAGGRWYGERWLRDVWDEEKGRFFKVAVPGVHLRAPLFVMTNHAPETMGATFRVHTEALWSRSPPVVIPDDPGAMLEWTLYLALTGNLISHDAARAKSISLKTRVAAMSWFVAHRHRIANLGPRTLKQIAIWFHVRGSEEGAKRAESFFDHARGSAPVDCTPQPDWGALRFALGGVIEHHARRCSPVGANATAARLANLDDEPACVSQKA